MIILGLGSNLGDRLFYLRKAYQLLRQQKDIQIKEASPIYESQALLPEQTQPDWDQPYLNGCLSLTTSLTPSELLTLLKKIEEKSGRQSHPPRWSPRMIDIDILAWDEKVISNETLKIPHEGLLERPFALWPLADLNPFWRYPIPGQHYGHFACDLVSKWGSRFTGDDAPLNTHQIPHRIDTPELVGIINVTPDSFSDGGQFNRVETAILQAHLLFQQGASVLDIGAESTRPNATVLTPRQEWERLQPILEALSHDFSQQTWKPKISIDTQHVEIAERALAYPIDWINDVSGFRDQAMRTCLAKSSAKLVCMHSLDIPPRREQTLSFDRSPVLQLIEWGQRKIEQLDQCGINPERVIFDPGIGFGKSKEQSIFILKQAQQFKQLGVPLLFGHSRKSFLELLCANKAHERDIETAAISVSLSQSGIDYLRVHHVDMTARALKLAKIMQNKE